MTKFLLPAIVAALTLVGVACASEEGAGLQSPGPRPETIETANLTPGPTPTATLTSTPTPRPRPRGTETSTATAVPSPTNEAAAASVRFAVKGDFGDGSQTQAAVTSRMCRWREAAGFSLVLTVGDNFYGPDGIATDQNYYDPERCLYSDPNHQWRAAWGNHDAGGSSTADVLGAPTSPRYYSWTAGRVAFFVYDGNEVTGEQGRWLREAVCSSEAPVKIIYGHQPPFSIGPHGSSSAVREMVHPVARDCDAKLVLSGHDHLYQRTSPIEGVTYIVTGGGGGVSYECQSSQQWVAICLSRHHFLYVEVETAVIRVSAVDVSGDIIDAVTIERSVTSA